MVLIGLVGCGKQADKHAAALRSAGADLVVTDLDTEAAAALAERHQATAVASADEIFAHPDLAGVDICTPTPSHHALCMQAIATGRPFFVEKPLCSTRNEASELAAAAAAAGVVGAVGYIYRYVPSIEKIREAVQAGALGDLLSATFRLGGRGNHQVWKHNQATGGGAISEMLVHLLDLAIWFFGPVREVALVRNDQLLAQRSFGHGPVDVDAEDRIIALVTCEHGPEILVQADFVSGVFHQSIDIHGSNGAASGSIDSRHGSYLHVHEALGGFEAGRRPLPETGDLHQLQMQEFLDVAAHGGTTVRSPLLDSVPLMQALELVRSADA